MDIERERVIEIVASVIAVLLMIGIMILIGRQYTQNGEFGGSGGLMLVVAIILFVLLMAVIGYVLAFVITDADETHAADASD